MEKRFAKFISKILHPFYMPTYGLLILYNSFLKSFFSLHEKASSFLIVFSFTIFVPALIIVFLLQTKRISNFNISDRKERTIPFLCVFCCYVLCAIVLLSSPLKSSFISIFIIGSAISILFLTIISVWWKISAHLTGIGGLCGTILGSCLWLNFIPLNLFVFCILLAGILAYARIELKEHTLTQTIGGFSLGFICLFLSNLFFAWTNSI